MKVGAKIVQRITGHNASDLAHSSGLAAMQRGEMKRRSGMTFAERQEIAQNRKIVQGYKNSRIARDYGLATGGYGRSETVSRGGYGRTEGERDMRCRYGRTETTEKDRYGRKSSEEIQKERMAQHSGEKRARTSSAPSATAPSSGTQTRKYYDFRPDFGSGV